VQGQICDILRPQLAMNRVLPLLATQIDVEHSTYLQVSMPTSGDILPVTYEPDGHDPDVEDGDDEKDDGDDDAVGKDDGVRAGEVVEDGGLRQYSAAVLTLQEILQRVNCKPGRFINKILYTLKRSQNIYSQNPNSAT
jgi:hypothetical protein